MGPLNVKERDEWACRIYIARFLIVYIVFIMLMKDFYDHWYNNLSNDFERKLKEISPIHLNYI